MDYIVRHSLGRDGHLGDLYNACSDQFSGENLFLNPLPTSLIRTEDVTDGAKMTVPFHDRLRENFQKLQVDLSSQLNVLCLHTRSLLGASQYLIDSNVSHQWGYDVRQSIIYTVPSKTQEFDPLDPDVIAHINVDAIKRTQATHVVTKINWGANAILTLKYEFGFMNYPRPYLKTVLYDMALDIMNKFINCKCISRDQNHMDFSLAADIEPHGFPVTSVQEVLKFMRGIPDILKKFYNNLGKPLFFILVPVNEIMKVLNLPDPHHSLVFREISDNKILFCAHLLECYDDGLGGLFDLEHLIRLKKPYFYFYDYPRLLHDVSTVRRNGVAYKAYLRKRLSKAVLVARTDGYFDAVNKIKTDAFNYYKDKFLEAYRKLRDNFRAMYWCEDIRKPGMDGINARPDYHFYTGPMCFEEKKNWNEWRAFVLLTRSDFKYTEPDFWAHLHCFIGLKGMKKDTEMWIVDLDRFPLFHFEQTRIVEIVVRDKKLFVLSEDYFKETANNGLNLMYSDSFDLVREEPTRSAAFKMFCPCYLGPGKCNEEFLCWHCARCREEVKYGYDYHFYCRCGRAFYLNYRFRCKNEEHGGYVEMPNPLLLDILQGNFYLPGFW